MTTLKFLVTSEMLEDWDAFEALFRSLLSDAMRELIKADNERQEQIILYGDGSEPRNLGIIKQEPGARNE